MRKWSNQVRGRDMASHIMTADVSELDSTQVPFLMIEVPLYKFLMSKVPLYKFLMGKVPLYTFLMGEVPLYTFLMGEVPLCWRSQGLDVSALDATQVPRAVISSHRM